jgi:hypothetical protein
VRATRTVATRTSRPPCAMPRRRHAAARRSCAAAALASYRASAVADTLALDDQLHRAAATGGGSRSQPAAAQHAPVGMRCKKSSARRLLNKGGCRRRSVGCWLGRSEGAG